MRSVSMALGAGQLILTGGCHLHRCSPGVGWIICKAKLRWSPTKRTKYEEIHVATLRTDENITSEIDSIHASYMK
jgi:hypothetical protein